MTVKGLENRVEKNSQNLEQKWEGKKAKKSRWSMQKVRSANRILERGAEETEDTSWVRIARN